VELLGNFQRGFFNTAIGALWRVEKDIRKLQGMHGIWRSSRPTVLYNVASLTEGKSRVLNLW